MFILLPGCLCYHILVSTAYLCRWMIINNRRILRKRSINVEDDKEQKKKKKEWMNERRTEWMNELNDLVNSWMFRRQLPPIIFWKQRGDQPSRRSLAYFVSDLLFVRFFFQLELQVRILKRKREQQASAKGQTQTISHPSKTSHGPAFRPRHLPQVSLSIPQKDDFIIARVRKRIPENMLLSESIFVGNMRGFYALSHSRVHWNPTSASFERSWKKEERNFWEDIVSEWKTLWIHLCWKSWGVLVPFKSTQKHNRWIIWKELEERGKEFLRRYCFRINRFWKTLWGPRTRWWRDRWERQLLPRTGRLLTWGYSFRACDIFFSPARVVNI